MLKYIWIKELLFGGMEVEYLTPEELRIRAKDMGMYQVQIKSILDVPNVGAAEKIGEWLVIITVRI